MIRGAIFDVDGTLLDSMPVWFDSGKTYLRNIGIVPEENLSERLFTMSLNDGAVYIKKRYNLLLSYKEIMRGIIGVIEEQYVNSLPLKNGAREMLECLHKAGVPMCIATAGDLSYLLPALKRLDIEKYFKRIYTCVELDTNKNEPLIFLSAAKCLGLMPKEVVVFEDAYMAARTAKEAGFKVVGVFDESTADHQEELKAYCDIYARDLSCVRLDDLLISG